MILPLLLPYADRQKKKPPGNLGSFFFIFDHSKTACVSHFCDVYNVHNLYQKNVHLIYHFPPPNQAIRVYHKQYLGESLISSRAAPKILLVGI